MLFTTTYKPQPPLSLPPSLPHRIVKRSGDLSPTHAIQSASPYLLPIKRYHFEHWLVPQGLPLLIVRHVLRREKVVGTREGEVEGGREGGREG